ncbi:hypothetical protein AKJ40_03910 [candidate division MSBL1 archaeon SCGC-AAA259M10]|uniref:Uncharacterized protein n=1 Tax=candidate division MSBL1 archaeon SCGC-AAA259M10 TaxID=1698270 RepID=A0A133UY83_9EURY|nr:hypothetical protein AKJ40_03910 [candidate division MSBL1 archaeon SCGC-AAA259M10]
MTLRIGLIRFISRIHSVNLEPLRPSEASEASEANPKRISEKDPGNSSGGMKPDKKELVRLFCELFAQKK